MEKQRRVWYSCPTMGYHPPSQEGHPDTCYGVTNPENIMLSGTGKFGKYRGVIMLFLRSV